MGATAWLVFGGLAAICWAIVGLLALRTMSYTSRTEGKVLENAVSSDDESTTYNPVVEFVAASRQKVRFTSRGTGKRNYDAGDAVPGAVPP